MLTTLLAIVGAALSVAGLLGGVVYYMRKAARDSAGEKQADAALVQEDARVAQMEKAAADARAERAKEFNAKATAVRTSADAAALLRAAGTDDPKVN